MSEVVKPDATPHATAAICKKNCALHNKCLNDNKSDLNFNLTDLKPLNTNSPTLVCSDYNIVLKSQFPCLKTELVALFEVGKIKQYFLRSISWPNAIK